MFAYSGTIPPSYKIELGDGRYVFVMLQKHSTEPLFSKTKQVYPASGLYLNDGSAVPLWTVNWYEERDGIFLTEDGSCLVRIGDVRIPNKKSISFYNNGQLKKSYAIKELIPEVHQLMNVQEPAISAYALGSKKWLIVTIYLDSLRRTLRIHFVSGERFIFDLASGEIISRKAF